MTNSNIALDIAFIMSIVSCAGLFSFCSCKKIRKLLCKIYKYYIYSNNKIYPNNPNINNIQQNSII